MGISGMSIHPRRDLVMARVSVETFASVGLHHQEDWARRRRAEMPEDGKEELERRAALLEELRVVIILLDIKKAYPNVCRARCWRTMGNVGGGSPYACGDSDTA